MKKKQLYINRKNERLGIILEEYNRQGRYWIIQHVDFIDDRWVRSFLFEHADPRLIKKFYEKIKETQE